VFWLTEKRGYLLQHLLIWLAQGAKAINVSRVHLLTPFCKLGRIISTKNVFIDIKRSILRKEGGNFLPKFLCSIG
jgi:hypothetical protein